MKEAARPHAVQLPCDFFPFWSDTVYLIYENDSRSGLFRFFEYLADVLLGFP